MSEPTWSILIATLSSRHASFLRLLDLLLPQTEADGAVEVVALHNDGERPVGDYRQALLEDARGLWVSFIDDDDLVAEDYVPAVRVALAEDPDYVAFRHAYYEDGVRDPHVTVTGLQYGGWYNTATEFIRDITHVNPARTSLALKAGFRSMGAGEDADYDGRLRSLLHTQVLIDRVLYHYYHSWSDSVQAKLQAHAHAPRPKITSPVFRWHAESTG